MIVVLFILNHPKVSIYYSTLCLPKKTCEKLNQDKYESSFIPSLFWAKMLRKMFPGHFWKCSTNFPFFVNIFVEHFSNFSLFVNIFCRTFFENVHGRNNFTNVRQIWVWKGKNLGWNFDKFSIVNIFFFVHGVNNFDFICRFKVSFYCSAVFLKLFIKYFA